VCTTSGLAAVRESRGSRNAVRMARIAKTPINSIAPNARWFMERRIGCFHQSASKVHELTAAGEESPTTLLLLGYASRAMVFRPGLSRRAGWGTFILCPRSLVPRAPMCLPAFILPILNVTKQLALGFSHEMREVFRCKTPENSWRGPAAV